MDLFAPLGLLGLLLLAVIGTDWRRGLLLCVVVGFLQDPLRKLAPGQPVYFVVLVILVFGLTALMAYSHHVRLRFKPVFGNDRWLITLVSLFVVLLGLQTVNSILRFGSPIVAGVGLLSYLSPVLALWLTYHYVRSQKDVNAFLLCYVIGSAVIAGTVYLSFLDFQSPLFLQGGGEGLVIYHPTAGKVQTHAGVMRSPDIASWHIATGVCLLMIWVVASGGRFGRLWLIALTVLMVGACIVTGRRKSIAQVGLFIALYGIMVFYFHQRTVKRAVLAVLAVAGLTLGVAALQLPEATFAEFEPYLDRTQTTLADAGERFWTLGIGSFLGASQNVDLLGVGVGIGTQGARHFAAQGEYGGGSEAGLGKLMIELGPVGFILIFLLAVAGARYLWKIMSIAQRRSAEVTALTTGLSALLLANAPLFMAAGQIYGDPFVLLVLGTCLGFILAAPKLLVLSFKF